MIQLATEVESLDSRKVPLGTRFKRIFLELASDRAIDFAIVNEKQLKDFEASETGDDVEIDWTAHVRAYEDEYELPEDNGKRYLLLWNANSDDDATIAYKITPLD
jgi:hypothetical protein